LLRLTPDALGSLRIGSLTKESQDIKRNLLREKEILPLLFSKRGPPYRDQGGVRFIARGEI
jgi:hypothetical protein